VTVHQQLTSSLPFLGWMLLQKLWLCELEVQWSRRSFEAGQTMLSLQRVVVAWPWLAGILSSSCEWLGCSRGCG